MRLPRDLNGEELCKLLAKYGFTITRQTGSHIRLTSTAREAEHHITIPNHSPLKIGTLNSILADVANNLEVEKKSLIKDLFKA